MKKLCDGLTYAACRLHNSLFPGLTGAKGASLVEYALLLLLIAVVVIAAIAVVGAKANNMYSSAASAFPPG